MTGTNQNFFQKGSDDAMRVKALGYKRFGKETSSEPVLLDSGDSEFRSRIQEAMVRRKRRIG